MSSNIIISAKSKGKSLALNLKSARKLGHVLDKLGEDTRGSIIVEMALVSPLIIGAFLVSSAYAQKVYQHQKLQSSIYAGSSYMLDAISAGDYSSLQRSWNEDGTQKESSLIETTKIVIKDASGMPLKLDDIDVDARCACPNITPQDIDDSRTGDSDKADPFEQDVEYYKMTSVAMMGQNICPAKCPDSYDARLIADITVTYTEKDLLGKTATLTQKLVTRLR